MQSVEAEVYRWAGRKTVLRITRPAQRREHATDWSWDLLYVDYCTAWDAGPDTVLGTDDDLCTSVTQVPLFGTSLLSYYWSYDNEGLKLAQLRFYEVATVAGR